MDLYEAVGLPRIHHQLLPNQIGIEPGFEARIAEGLVKLGHEVCCIPHLLNSSTHAPSLAGIQSGRKGHFLGCPGHCSFPQRQPRRSQRSTKVWACCCLLKSTPAVQTQAYVTSFIHDGQIYKNSRVAQFK